MFLFCFFHDTRIICAYSDCEKLYIVYSTGTLSLLTNNSGGIIDDCIITRIGTTSFYIVSNAGRAEVDLHHLQVIHNNVQCM